MGAENGRRRRPNAKKEKKSGDDYFIKRQKYVPMINADRKRSFRLSKRVCLRRALSHLFAIDADTIHVAGIQSFISHLMK